MSLYFKTLVKLRNLKEGDKFVISIPFNIRKSHVLFFINVIKHAKPHLYSLIMLLCLGVIFLLTDFFQIDIFIKLNEMFCADLNKLKYSWPMRIPKDSSLWSKRRRRVKTLGTTMTLPDNFNPRLMSYHADP